MHGINFEVIQKVRRWLDGGDDLWFVTIVETWGASPRPIGSIFAYNPGKDLMAGSLSGGCIEEDLLEQLSTFSPSLPKRKRYGDSEEEQQRFQLPCGGSIELVIEAISCTAENKNQFAQIESTLHERQRIKRCLDLRSGEVRLEAPNNLVDLKLEDNAVALTLGPQYHLLIVGMGEICRYLIPLAKSLDFAVTVCDPRESVVNRTEVFEKDFDYAEGLPDDVVRERFKDPYSAIVALSHDPRVDDLALIAALETDAFYIGAMGSERTSNSRFDRLASLGLPQASLAKLHAPIGLDIGSKTPPEIAVSIAAELIKQRTLTAVH